MQAVEMVKNQDFDIIIMDVMMPKLDGYSACKEIRKIKQIPVIMLSAIHNRQRLSQSRKACHTPRPLRKAL